MSIVTWEFESPPLHFDSQNRFYSCKYVISSSPKGDFFCLWGLPLLFFLFFFLCFLVELPTVIYVVPNAIEATCDAGYGRHESVAHPDGKDGVLLSAGLGGTDSIVVFPPHQSAKGKLHDAGNERDDGNGCLIAPRHVAVDDALYRYGNGECQTESPEVEREVAITRKPFRGFGREPSQDDGKQEGTEQQGKYATNDGDKGTEEAHSGVGVNDGYNQWYQNGHSQIDDDGVCHQCAGISSQFARNDCGGSGSRAYHAKHPPFDDNLPVRVGYVLYQQGTEPEAHCLEQQ